MLKRCEKSMRTCEMFFYFHREQTFDLIYWITKGLKYRKTYKTHVENSTLSLSLLPKGLGTTIGTENRKREVWKNQASHMLLQDNHFCKVNVTANTPAVSLGWGTKVPVSGRQHHL